jgi:putative redox protein
MPMKISTSYEGSMRFASGDGDARVVMDAKAEAGGLGIAPNPKQMVLQGLAGCTGLDVVAILKRKGVEYDRFSIDVEAEQTAINPKVFKVIKIIYRFVGDPADRPVIERAIELSKGQFCGVSAMLAKTAKLEWALEIAKRG